MRLSKDEIAEQYANDAVREMADGYVFVEDFGKEIIKKAILAAINPRNEDAE